MRVVCVLASAVILACAASVSAQELTFRSIIDKSPLDVTPKPGEVVTDAVNAFRRTGQNPYTGKADAVAQGKKLYIEYCESCHMSDGSGRMGPSLIEDYHVYEEIKTDAGLFEIVFGGGFGAMQPFSKRLSQDEILKVMAYVRTLMKP
ncbi:MAG: c-type cytochrome [Hyphomonadaceae bacterium]|jgi:cytochrome c-L|nr:c-type cytochrome [Hyphomonadaceae bacterium]